MSKNIEIKLQDFHEGQIKVYENLERFNALLIGRRFGKTTLLNNIICDAVIRGKSVGYFAPSFKILAESMRDISDKLAPVIASSNKNDGIIRTKTGGSLDFWSTENSNCGRSRGYDLVAIDEAGFLPNGFMHTYNTSIAPTLLYSVGSCIVAGTPASKSSEDFFYLITTDPQFGFKVFHAPTSDNPLIPREELTRIKETTDPRVFQQEYEATWVNWEGTSLFDINNCLDENKLPLSVPPIVDSIFAVIDSATKTGAIHDATAVAYWAYLSIPEPRLILLDWNLVKISGDLLEHWLPTVLDNITELSKGKKLRYGSLGIFIEDRNSGMILLQQAKRKGLPVTAINTKLTSKGKTERAIAASGYIYQKKVQISEHAYNKTVKLDGITRNYLLQQVFEFIVGEEGDKRADDLLDCFTYGCLIALGDKKGF